MNLLSRTPLAFAAIALMVLGLTGCSASEEVSTPTQNLDRETISNMDALLKIFGGKQQRSNMEEVPHHGVQPRRWRRMAGIEGLEDCEPVESSIWCQNVNPQMPRTVQRERQARGGSLAIGVVVVRLLISLCV